jgi:hypothetical protein
VLGCDRAAGAWRGSATRVLTRVPGRHRSPRGRPLAGVSLRAESKGCVEKTIQTVATGIPDHTLEQLSGATVASPAARTRARCSVQPPWHIAVFTDQVSGQPVLGHRLRRTHGLRPAAKSPPASSRSASSVTDRNHLAVRVRCLEAGRLNSAAAGAWWVSTRKGLVWVVADPAGRTSASEPKATEARRAEERSSRP